jgi:hypothetical protein
MFKRLKKPEWSRKRLSKERRAIPVSKGRPKTSRNGRKRRQIRRSASEIQDDI